jgi:hypothetical protein
MGIHVLQDEGFGTTKDNDISNNTQLFILPKRGRRELIKLFHHESSQKGLVSTKPMANISVRTTE